MLRRIYNHVLALSARPSAPIWLAAISFAEASFFPVPPDVLLLPMVLARPRRAWWLALVCTLASVAGGALGYLIGAVFFDQVAAPLLRAYGYGDAFLRFQQRFLEYGLWVILIKGLTPIPYKIVTIACGAAHFSFPVFMAASLATRGARFFLLAGLLRVFGEPIRHFVERWLTWVTTAIVAACLLGVLALHSF